jgi:TetR/AcrR family transcriptional regulator
MSMATAAARSEAPFAWEDRALDRSLSAARDRSAARGRRLVDAARALANESGSSAFTVGDVATRAGISLRSFYRHFAGKDELLLALFEEEARLGVDLLDQALGDEVEPLARLRGYVVGLSEFVARGSGYAALLVREHLRLGQSHPDEMRAALMPLVDFLELELRAASAAGDIREVDGHDAILVFSLILSHVHMAILFSPHEDPAVGSARLWAFCRAALAPSEGHR